MSLAGNSYDVISSRDGDRVRSKRVGDWGRFFCDGASDSSVRDALRFKPGGENRFSKDSTGTISEGMNSWPLELSMIKLSDVKEGQETGESPYEVISSIDGEGE